MNTGRLLRTFTRTGAGGLLFVLVQASGAGPASTHAAAAHRLDPLLSIALPGAEIPAVDPLTGHLFVTCAEGLARITDLAGSCDAELIDPASGLAGAITHVATDPARRGIGIVTVAATSPIDPGWVVFFSTRSGAPLARLEVGCHPDAAAFSPDGQWLVVANEGEAAESALGAVIDPPGSVTLIDQRGCRTAYDFTQPLALAPRTLCFDDHLCDASGASASSLRIHPRTWSAPHLDLEPEYVVASDDAAWVTFQENNAIGRLDFASGEFHITPLGAVAQRLDGQSDGVVALATDIDALPMPDQLAWFEHRGRVFLVTADEGDTRGGMGRDGAVADVSRIGELVREGRIRPDVAARLPADLQVCAFTGDEDGDGVIDRPVVIGSRGVSIWDTATLRRVGHTGDAIERAVARAMPRRFNADASSPRRIDTRSDQRGPEPEGVAIARIDGRPLAFVGLERPGAIALIDLEDPAAPVVLDIFDTTLDDGRAPEGMTFLPASSSPFQCDVLIVAFETSGRVGIYAVR